MKYNAAADEFLKDLYESVGAITAEQKYNTLVMRLGYQDDTITFSHDPSWKQKQTMLEYDLLERQLLIELIYC
jgi:hypothetical protein